MVTSYFTLVTDRDNEPCFMYYTPSDYTVKILEDTVRGWVLSPLLF